LVNISSGNHQGDNFYAFHTLDHPNIQRPHSDVCYLFVWFGRTGRLTFASWCTECQPCQLAKVVKEAVSAVTSIPIPVKSYGHLHIDLVGPLAGSSESYKHRYLITMVERPTSWLEGHGDLFLHVCQLQQWYTTTTADCDRQISLALWEALSNYLVFSHITTPHIPTHILHVHSNNYY
jgi:hypothetical protein